MNKASDFYYVVDKRRTVRGFQEQDIEEAKINRILACGLRAPTHDHLREWHFILLRDKALRKKILEKSGAFSRTPDREFLNDMLAELDNEQQKEVYAYSVPLQEKILLSAPEVVMICFKMKKKLTDCKTLFELNGFASVWLAIENILLAMAADDLYGVTMVPFKTQGIKDIMNIPDDIEIATFIAFGYADKEPKLSQVKKDLEDIIHIDRW